VTMVWEDSKASHENNCTMKAIVTGYGELYENNGRLPLRLKDRALQLDFYCQHRGNRPALGRINPKKA